MGIGFVLTVDADDADQIVSFFEKQGEKAYKIGTVIEGEGVQFVNEGTEN